MASSTVCRAGFGASRSYLDKALGSRDDAAGMQFLVPGWTVDDKRPCLVR